MNRKGSAQDILLIVGILFALGIGFLIMNYVSNQMYGALLSNGQINESNETVTVLQESQEVSSSLDSWIVGVFFGLVLALIITAWFVSGNPLFMGIYVIVLIIGVVVSMVLSNVWETVSQQPVFASSLADLPFTNHILLYLPYYASAIGMIGIIVLFAKPFFRPGGDL